MFFLTLGDNMNEKIDVVCPPEETSSYEEFLAPNRPVKIHGRTVVRNDQVTVRIERMEIPELISGEK